MTTIGIEPPAFGPVRLGMTEAEAKAALSTLGEVEQSDDRIYSYDRSTGLIIHVEADMHHRACWIAGMVSDDVVRLEFRGIDLCQPANVVLRAIHALGFGIATETDWGGEYLVEEVGLLLRARDSEADMEADRFGGVVIATPAKLRESSRVPNSKHRIDYVPI